MAAILDLPIHSSALSLWCLSSLWNCNSFIISLYCGLSLLVFHLTLSHGQAAVERGFCVPKEALAPNLKEDSLKVICLVHDTISAEQIEIAEFVIIDELHTCCSQANSRYKMYLMDKDKEAQEPEKARKRKLFKKSWLQQRKWIGSHSREVSRVSW